MGVVHLYTFMEKIGALDKIYISNEVECYRKRTKQNPVIVVDSINLIYSLYRYKNLPFLFGGQLKEFKEHLEYFIEIFKKEGVDLVFYFDGPSVIFNKEGWISRRKRNIMKINRIFDIVNNYKTYNIENDKRNLIIPRNIYAITMFVLKQKGCKVKISVAECDRELALYAKHNNCMAILAIDTDFVIYDTVKIFTTIQMDLNEMSFYMYNKRKVLEKLMLKSSELPLLASLVGNDYIPENDLYAFHAQLKKGNSTKFDKVADYIRKLNLKIYNGQISTIDIKRITMDIFGDKQKFELLENSINSYNTKLGQYDIEPIIKHESDSNWQSIIKMIYQDYVENGDNERKFTIIVRGCLQCSNSLEDLRCKDMPPVSQVLKVLRSKLYGILMYEKPGPKQIEEWVINGYNTVGQPDYVEPQQPNVHHPGLIYLLTGNDEEAQWTILGDMFSLDPVHIKSLPKHLIIPALTFRYLKDKIVFKEGEMNALMLSAVLVSHFSVKKLVSITINEIDSRSIRLYNLVTYTYDEVLEVFQILKNIITMEMALPSNYQDGKLFHLLYNMSCFQNVSIVEISNHILKSTFQNERRLLDSWNEEIDKLVTFLAA